MKTKYKEQSDYKKNKKKIKTVAYYNIHTCNALIWLYGKGWFDRKPKLGFSEDKEVKVGSGEKVWNCLSFGYSGFSSFGFTVSNFPTIPFAMLLEQLRSFSITFDNSSEDPSRLFPWFEPNGDRTFAFVLPGKPHDCKAIKKKARIAP